MAEIRLDLHYKPTGLLIGKNVKFLEELSEHIKSHFDNEPIDMVEVDFIFGDQSGNEPTEKQLGNAPIVDESSTFQTIIG